MLYAETADPTTLCPPDAPLARRTRLHGWERVLHGDGIRSVRGARGTFKRDGGGHRVLLCARAALVAEGRKNMSCSEGKGKREKGKGKREKRRTVGSAPQPPTHLSAQLSRKSRDEKDEEGERKGEDKPSQEKIKHARNPNQNEQIKNNQYHIRTQATHTESPINLQPQSQPTYLPNIQVPTREVGGSPTQIN